MTMNIMSVQAQAGQEKAGKAADAPAGKEAGMFAELFTQETASQQSALASESSSSAKLEGKPSELAPDMQVITDKAEAEAEVDTDADAKTDAKNEDAETDELATAKTHTPNTEAASQQDGEDEQASALLATPIQAAMANSEPSTHAASPEQAAQGAGHTKAGLGGNSLPLANEAQAQAGDSEGADDEKIASADKQATTDKQATADKQATTDKQAESSSASLSAKLDQKSERADKETGQAGKNTGDTVKAESLASTAGASKAPADPTNKVTQRQPQATTLPGQSAGASSSQGQESLSNNAPTATKEPASEADFQPTRLAQAVAGATKPHAEATQPASSSDGPKAAASGTSADAAKILADANISVSGQTDSDKAAIQAQVKAAEVTSGTSAAQIRAPEWLAQIEHGRRWSQSPESGVKQEADGKSVALGEKVALEVKDTTVLSEELKAALSDKNSEQAPELSSAQLSSGRLADASTHQQTITPPDAGIMATAREVSPQSLGAERVPTLDKAVSLQGSAEQTAKQLAQQAQVVVSQNLQEADIKLNPSEFGAMRIQVKIEQGEVQVQFVASQPQARELMEQAMPRLREMLSQQGMQLNQGQQQGQQGQQGQSGQQQQQFTGQTLSQSGQQAQQGSQQQSQQRQSGDESNNLGGTYTALGAREGENGHIDMAGGALAQRTAQDTSRIDYFA
ncbi:MAG: flagellar hook-length control protein FliK [Oceanisphaera sp.]